MIQYQIDLINQIEIDSNLFNYQIYSIIKSIRSYSNQFDPIQINLILMTFLIVRHVGVRVASTGKLVGIITGVPCETRVYTGTFLGVEINFLW